MKRLKIISLLFCVLFILGCNSNTKKVTISDLEIIYQDKEFYITPKIDIDNLEIEYLLYDEQGMVIGTYVKEVGNVISERTYKIKAKPLFMLQEPYDGEVVKIKGERSK